MLFEDFNYQMFNKYILRDPTKEKEDDYSDDGSEDFTVGA